MDKLPEPSTALDITEMVKQTPAWAAAKARVVNMAANGASNVELAAAVIEEMRSELDIEALVQGALDGSGLGLDEADRESLVKYYSLHVLAAVVADIQGIEHPLAPMMAGGIQVLVQSDSEIEYPVVIAIASPLTPLSVADDFREVILSTFVDPIKDSKNGQRDAEWLGRKLAGETYRQIVLSDSRAGLSPEVHVNPDDYPAEVVAAIDKVAKAVQRCSARWTKAVSSLSKE